LTIAILCISLANGHISIFEHWKTNPYNMNKIRSGYLPIAAFLVLGTACQKKTTEKTEDDSSKVKVVTDYDQEIMETIHPT